MICDLAATIIRSELSTTTRQNRLEEVQGAATSYLFLPPLKTRGRVYSSCAMLHASETWPLTYPHLQRLQQNYRAMIRQICNVKPQDIGTTRLALKIWTSFWRRLHCYGQVERSKGAVKTAFDMQADGKRVPKRLKMTWKQLTEGLQRVEALGYQPSWWTHLQNEAHGSQFAQLIKTAFAYLQMSFNIPVLPQQQGHKSDITIKTSKVILVSSF